MDRTALLLLFIAVLKYNQSASTDKSCYVWLARWVNTQKLSSVDSSVPVWISSASRLIDVAKTINVSTPDKQRRDLFTHNCRAQDDQVYIFACSLLVADFLSASPSHLDAVEEIRAAYEVRCRFRSDISERAPKIRCREFKKKVVCMSICSCCECIALKASHFLVGVTAPGG